MKVKRPRARTMVIGLAAGLALATGGMVAITAVTVVNPGHAASSSTARTAALRHQELAVKAHTALLRYLRENRPPADLVRPGGLDPSNPNLKAGSTAAAAVQSFNWSGYADSSSTPNTFTAVSARWRQPATACSPEQELTATWVGLDGYTDQTVEQDGTLAYCFEGLPYYYTWWEMFPGSSVTVGSTVQPGDLITASVSRSGTSYTLSLTDATTPGNSFSTVQTCLPAGTCTNESAEWIVERPAFPIGVTPLAFFRALHLTRGAQTANGTAGSIASGPSATQITMVDATATYPLDSVSPLTRAGTGFTARWLNSY